MRAPQLDAARDLAAFIDASPSPHHACAEAARRLEAAGFTARDETAAWSETAGRYYVVRGGSLIAWVEPEGADVATPFRLLGAHTDSPNLRLKPKPDRGRAGWRQLGVEIYGGALLNSWLDRDLGLSGRVWLKGDDAPVGHTFRVDRPILRVPQLAIHLHREIRTDGLKLNAQKHMSPVFGLGSSKEGDFRAWLADEIGVEGKDMLTWEAMTHDLTPSTLSGPNEEFLSAPRLDNLHSCWTTLGGMLDALDGPEPPRHTLMVTLFDHEEVGSGSRSGAEGPLVRTLLERIVLGRGGDREAFHRALVASQCVSADMAHAVHPNYPDKHDDGHHVQMNAGPVIKTNQNLRYASEGLTEARFELACQEADVPYQKWVMRSDLACGSTIGPITAMNLGMPVVDVGCPQLAMHSAREFGGSHDPGYMRAALAAFCA
tara:strand:+ start:8863 stop:10155 length:1293 start_codon:yes stop_codon:yes gene_type:complete